MGYFEHYQRVNNLSEAGRRSHWRSFARTVGRFLPANRAAHIVDVGCGAGLLLEWLNSCGYSNAKGIDPDQGQVDFCKSLGLNAAQVADSAQWLRELSELDMVVFKDVLEHVQEDEVVRLLAAAHKALSPEGVLYVSVPNAAASFSNFWLYNDPTHLRSYTEKVLSLQLISAGFNVVHVGDDETYLVGSLAGVPRLIIRTIFRFIRRIEAIGEFGADGLRMPLGLNLMIVATRNG